MVSLALNFDMDVDPAELAILEADLDESVGKAFSELGIAHHLPYRGGRACDSRNSLLPSREKGRGEEGAVMTFMIRGVPLCHDR